MYWPLPPENMMMRSAKKGFRGEKKIYSIRKGDWLDLSSARASISLSSPLTG